MEIEEQQHVEVKLRRSEEYEWLVFESELHQIPALAVKMLSAIHRGHVKVRTKGEFRHVDVECDGRHAVFYVAGRRAAFRIEIRSLKYAVSFLTQGFVCGFSVDHIDLSCADNFRDIIVKVTVDPPSIPASDFRSQLETGAFGKAPVPIIKLNTKNIEAIKAGDGELIEVILHRNELAILVMTVGYALMNEEGGAIIGDHLEMTAASRGTTGTSVGSENLERFFQWGLDVAHGKGPFYLSLAEGKSEIVFRMMS